jgi:hypothetical protein
MAGRPGLFGGSRQDDASEPGSATSPYIRIGELAGEGVGLGPEFDPVWGTLGAPPPPEHDPWLSQPDGEEGGKVVEVEVFGNGFQISGQIQTGQFERLSDWLNMQNGFVRVNEASLVHLGLSGRADTEHDREVMWVRLDQIVLIAERAPVQAARPGAPMIQKQRRRVTIVTPGFNLRGSLHVHAYGSMRQFLETPDPHFLPLTDVTLRWLSDDTLVSHFPFAIINREQLITIIDEAQTAGQAEQSDKDEETEEQSSGAA